MVNIGLIDADLISLINWKKSDEHTRKKLVCNQLSMIDQFVFHEFWWKAKGVNKELYWELQYLWLDEHYFHTGYFKELMWRCLKLGSIRGLVFYFIKWMTWEELVSINYVIHVTLPRDYRINFNLRNEN